MSWDPKEEQDRKHPTELTTYPKWLFRVLYSWRDVGIDNHLGDGNLSDLTAHATDVVNTDTLLNNYHLPIVMSFPGTHSPGAGTLATDQGQFAFTAVVYADIDLEPEFALENAMEYAGNIVTNIERDPTLTTGGEDDRAKVAACRLTNFEPDFEQNPPPNRAPLKWCAVSFTCDLKRRYGHVGANLGADSGGTYGGDSGGTYGGTAGVTYGADTERN